MEDTECPRQCVRCDGMNRRYAKDRCDEGIGKTMKNKSFRDNRIYLARGDINGCDDCL